MFLCVASETIIITYNFAGCLTDQILWKMSKLVTSHGELTDLGVDVLQIPQNRIRTALTNHSNSIHDAAHDVLSEWRLQYEKEHEAYNTLYMGLRRCRMNQWAAQLEKLSAESQVTTQGRLCSSEKG